MFIFILVGYVPINVSNHLHKLANRINILSCISTRTHTAKNIVCLISNFCCVLNVVCFLLGNSLASEFRMPTFLNTLFRLHRPMKIEHSVPKYRHIKFRRRRITQKKAYNNIVRLSKAVNAHFTYCTMIYVPNM
jgi:hypothetical protein